MPKDAAADRALHRLSEGDRLPLKRARDVYLGDAADDWTGLESAAMTSAVRLAREIARARRP